MVRMLQPNPARRLTLSEVMAHPWFRQDLPPHLATLNDRLLQVRRLRRHRNLETCSVEILVVSGSVWI